MYTHSHTHTQPKQAAAEQYCPQCSAADIPHLFCKACCTREHASGVGARHRPISTTEPQAARIVKCPEHTSERMDLFCVTDQVLTVNLLVLTLPCPPPLSL